MRYFSSGGPTDISRLRNIGISAHIDSGKTTFTERVLYYCGRIDSMHEVRGGDGVGATMDSMELEREKGITIQSAATSVTWKDTPINIIDTPGHVDFTIEVERALRVLDGAILIICGASGIQAQTITVDKQMKRYSVPRLVFINKLDRLGADPWKCIEGLRNKLGLSCAAVQIPIGLEDDLEGLVDIIEMKAYFPIGKDGSTIKEGEIPAGLLELAQQKRQELIDYLADVDPEMEEIFLEEREPTVEEIHATIRRACIARTFCPVFMGSAYKNKGVQFALDGVEKYLPSPIEKENYGFMKRAGGVEEQIVLHTNPKEKFVGLAFKLEEGKFGQLTYVRVYQGRLKKGEYIVNANDMKKHKVSRMVKMHSNSMTDIDVVEAGDIFALFGTECSSGDSLVDPKNEKLSLSSMHVPDPVLSLSVKPKVKSQIQKMTKALDRFKREDPTFHLDVDPESDEMVISGMGELHLQIYAERLRREYALDIEVGTPTVNYRETITGKVDFDYFHKKQSGGSGQYARVMGYMEPIPAEDGQFFNIFENQIQGTSIPNEFISSIERQFHDSCMKGPLTKYPIVNTKYVLQDGQTHVVDSSSGAFATATNYSIRQVFEKDGGVLLEPLMNIEITVPKENGNEVMAVVNKRSGYIYHTEGMMDIFVIKADVPLAKMFGFATDLRGLTMGQGEFSMEYKTHAPVDPGEQQKVIDTVQKKLKEDGK